MTKEDYEKYYQTGGSYIIPVEVFNELFDDYECFKNDCKKQKEVIDRATNYYYKTIAEYEKENKQMPEESVMMFNLMEWNR